MFLIYHGHKTRLQLNYSNVIWTIEKNHFRTQIAALVVVVVATPSPPESSGGCPPPYESRRPTASLHLSSRPETSTGEVQRASTVKGVGIVGQLKRWVVLCRSVWQSGQVSVGYLVGSILFK